MSGPRDEFLSEAQMADVFISYARADAAIVRRLHAALTEQGRSVWVDWKDIAPSAEWMQEILAAIEGADVFLFAISLHSIDSHVCREELDHALGTNKRLIPLLCNDVEPSRVHDAVRRLQWIPLRDRDDFEEGLRLLASAIDTDLAWVRMHTRLLVRALEWTQREQDVSLLIRGSELQEAVQWLTRFDGTQTPAPTDAHREFVNTSRQWETQETERIRRLNRVELSRRLAAQADHAQTVDLALLLAAEAQAASPTAEANTCLLSALRRAPRLRRMLWGGGQQFTHVAFSPDGKLIAASSSTSARIVVWRAASGSRIAAPRVPAPAHWIQFTRSGALLHAGLRHVGVLDIKTRRDMPLLTLGQNGRGFALHPDGRLLAVGDDRFAVTVFDLQTAQVTAPPRIGHKGGVRVVAFSPDGRCLASAGDDGYVRVWDVHDGSDPGRSLGRIPGAAAGIAFDAAAAAVFSAGADGRVMRWPLDPGGGPQQLHQYDQSVSHLSLSPDGTQFAVARAYDTSPLSLWDLRAEPVEAHVTGHPPGAWKVAFSPEGQTVADIAGGRSEMVLLWDAGRFVPRGDPLDAGEQVTAVAFGPGASTLFGITFGGALREWRVESGLLERTLDVSSGGGRALAVHPAGTVLATSSDKRELLLVQLDDPDLPVSALEGHDNFITAIAFDRHGRLIASGDDARTVLVREASGLRTRFRLRKGHRGGIRDLAFHPSESWLVVAAGFESLVLWDLSGDRAIPTILPVRGRRANRVAFSPDGRLLAWGSDDGTAEIWDVASWSMLGKPLAWAEGQVQALAFSGDGATLATGSGDGSVVLWDVKTQNRKLALSRRGSVSDLAFAADHALLASATEHAVVVWDVDCDLWADRARRVANRHLTESEWRRYVGEDVPYPHSAERKRKD